MALDPVAEHPFFTRPVADPRAPWYQRVGFHIALAVVAMGVIALGGLAMLTILGQALGPFALVLASGAAIIPVPVVISCFLWLDRYHPEPWYYLLFVFGWGACVATLSAYFLNTEGNDLITQAGGNESVTAIFIAPPVEETSKAIPVFIIMALSLLGRRRINGIVDGMVYAGVSAVGFAFTENILYFGSQYVQVSSKTDPRSGLASVITLFILRGVLSPFAHPLFTCMTGIGVGIGVKSRYLGVRIGAPLIGLALAMAMHSTWNVIVSSASPQAILLGYGFIMFPIFVAVVCLGIYVRGREAHVLPTALAPYIEKHWLTANEVTSLSTMRARRAARQWGRQLGGGLGAQLMRDYQFAATRLAVLRDGVTHGVGEHDFAEEERELLATVAVRRHMLLEIARRKFPVG